MDNKCLTKMANFANNVGQLPRKKKIENAYIETQTI